MEYSIPECIHSVEKEGCAWVRACMCERTNTVHVTLANSGQVAVFNTQFAKVFSTIIFCSHLILHPMFMDIVANSKMSDSTMTNEKKLYRGRYEHIRLASSRPAAQDAGRELRDLLWPDHHRLPPPHPGGWRMQYAATCQSQERMSNAARVHFHVHFIRALHGEL